MPGVQPALSMDDVVESEPLLKANKQFQAFIAKRYGITDVENELAVDPWYSGYRFGHPAGRILQFLLYRRSSPNDNHYAHPLDAVVFYDPHTDTIHDIQAWGGDQAAPVPRADANYHRDLIERPWRTSMKPLDVVQPEGPSFSVDGNTVSWEGWQFHVGFSWREGLILNDIQYNDQGRLRPVMHRAALAEIIVPYGEGRDPFQYKCAYDICDYGLGLCANSLELGCDCLGHIKYFDAVVNNAKGQPVTIRKAVCMHEEDASIAWKQLDYRTGHLEVRRLRRLVVSFWATIANYSYGFYWYLGQDGTISFECKLTGIVSTNSLYPDEFTPDGAGEPRWGTRVGPGVVAQVHQHFFCVRLDPAVDCPEGGKNLQVLEVEAVPAQMGPENMHGVGFDVAERVLRSEGEAVRDCAHERSRVWKVQNPNVLNPTTGKPVAFKIMPATPCPPMLAHPTSAHATRGNFATKHLWVTAYDPKEMNPAGDYPLHPDPTQNTGLADWAAKDRPLDGADCVLWFNLGITHVVRPEDWPVMPVESLMLHFKPWGFFDSNPALDIPPIRNAASRNFDDAARKGAPGATKQVVAACCAKPPQPPAQPLSRL